MNKKYKKRTITAIAILSMFICSQNSVMSNSTVCVNKCPKGPYQIQNFISRGLQNISGLNFIATKIAESAIRKNLARYATGKVNVDVDSFSAIDLASGKLKCLKIDAQNVKLNDLFISSINAKSQCEFIHIDYKAKPLAIIEPLTITFDGEITEADLNKTVASKNYQDKISTIKLNGQKIKILNFKDPKVKLENGRMKLFTNVEMPGILKIKFPLEINADLKVADNKIFFNDVKLMSKGNYIKLKLPQSVYENINPVLYNRKEIEKDGKKLNFESIAITDKKLDVKGTYWLPKTP